MWVCTRRGVEAGFLQQATWDNVRLEFKAMFMLSVLAIGRKVLKKSVRLMAGIGEVDDGVGAVAIEPEEDLRSMSEVV